MIYLAISCLQVYCTMTAWPIVVLLVSNIAKELFWLIIPANTSARLTGCFVLALKPVFPDRLAHEQGAWLFASH